MKRIALLALAVALGVSLGWMTTDDAGAQIGYTRTLARLDDVTITAAADNDILQYSSSATAWVDVTPATIGGDIALNDLSDTNAGSPNDNDSLRWDNGTSKWIAEAVTSLTIGTLNTLPKFTAADLADSSLLNAGAPAAGASGNSLVLDDTYNAMDGSDTVYALWIDQTNYDSADHTGSTNVYAAIGIEGITQDAQASEYAISIGTGWDRGLNYDGGHFPIYGTHNIRLHPDSSANPAFEVNASGGGFRAQVGGPMTAGASTDMLRIVPSSQGAMDGADTQRGLIVNLPNADHTGASNLLYGIDIDGITGDADATEAAINIGEGWDRAILVGDSDATGTSDGIFLGAASDMGLWWNNGGTSAYLHSDANMTVQFLDGYTFYIRTVNSSKVLQTIPITLRDVDFSVASYNVMLLGGGYTLRASNGGDTKRVLFVDITNPNHTGVSNVVYGIDLDAITGDAQARETAVNIGTGWDVGISSANHIFQRENFQQGFRKNLASDFSAATDTDGSVNIVLGTNGVNFEYREEQDKTTSSFILDNAGAIDISADNTTDNEGVEFMLGSSQTTTSGYLIAQTDQLCFSVNVKVTLIAGTDQFVIGWRANQAYEAANIYTNYSDYNVVGINNVDGSVFGLSDSTTGAAETDDSGTNWADGETKTLKACIDGAGLPHGYLDGTLITETNRTTAMDAGINMVPFISYLQAGGAADAAILINWWEITAN